MMRQKIDKLKIVEGVAGIWHYHLSISGENYQEALCGERKVMKTEVPLSSWGFKGGNVPSSYCTECERIYKELK
jgi:hypothetical protein